MDQYYVQEFNPVDGVFFLIYRNGEMIAKTWRRKEAEAIVSALSNSQRDELLALLERHLGDNPRGDRDYYNCQLCCDTRAALSKAAGGLSGQVQS